MNAEKLKEIENEFLKRKRTIYQVIAALKGQENNRIQSFWIVKEYKRLSSAEKFFEKQKNHPKYFFKINIQ